MLLLENILDMASSAIPIHSEEAMNQLLIRSETSDSGGPISAEKCTLSYLMIGVRTNHIHRVAHEG